MTIACLAWPELLLDEGQLNNLLRPRSDAMPFACVESLQASGNLIYYDQDLTSRSTHTVEIWKWTYNTSTYGTALQETTLSNTRIIDRY